MRRKTYQAWDAVKEFHERNGAIINLEPVKTPQAAELAILRIRLITEELGETMVAVHGKDLISTADGLADLLYVILGTGVSYGVVVPDMFEEPGEDGLRIHEGDVIRFAAAVTESLVVATKGIKYCTTCDCPDPQCAYKSLGEDDLQLLGQGLGLLARSITGFASDCGIPLEEIFKEVHRSNLTKNLGGTKAGEKYAPGGGKGSAFTPPNIAGILCIPEVPK